MRGAVERYAPATAIPSEDLLTSPLESVDGARLLDDVSAFLGRFLILPRVEARDMLAASDSPHARPGIERRARPRLCKSPRRARTAANRPCATCSPSLCGRRGRRSPIPAVLYRKVDRDRPTLLLDEFDGYSFEDRRDALSVLNAGYKAGATVDRCTDKGELQSFSAFCPKALVGIDEGQIPDALLSRTITVRMGPRRPDETVEDALDPAVKEESDALRERCRQWAELALDELEAIRPDTLGMINRPAEIWRPLLAIGEHVGGDWTERVRQAARALGSGGDARDEQSSKNALLRDLREAFDSLLGRDVAFTSELLDHLNGLEEQPWQASRRGLGLDARGLATRLRPFGVKPVTVRVGTLTGKGYRLADLETVFARYLAHPLKSVTTVTSSIHAGLLDTRPSQSDGRSVTPLFEA